MPVGACGQVRRPPHRREASPVVRDGAAGGRRQSVQPVPSISNFPPPNDIVARSAALSPTASTAPTRSTGHARVPRGSVAAPVRLVRRGRSICPRCSRGRRLFRHSGVKLEAQVAVSAPGTNSDGS